MDKRIKMKNRKLVKEEGSKMKEDLEGGKALFKRKDKVIRRNDIIVSPFANKIKLESGENSNPVKQEGEEEDVRGEEGVEVVTVEEKVDLSEEPGVEQEGEAGQAVDAASRLIAGGAQAEALRQSMEARLDPTATPMPLQETVNYLVDVVGCISADLNAVKEKLSMVSPEILPPQPSSSAGPSSPVDPPSVEGSQDEDNPLCVSPLASEDGSGSKHCLVCFKDVPSSKDDVQDDHPLVTKQLEGIFILNKLLCIPSTSLGKYLEMCPNANPASWINLCGDCREMVTKAWRIHDEIVNASKKLKRIQEKLISKIKGSTIGPQETSGPHSEPSDIGTVVTRESRKFVREHDYGDFLDPFPQEDREACRILTRDNTRNEAKRLNKSKGTQQVENQVLSSTAADLRRKLRERKSQNTISGVKKSRKRLIDEEGAFFREDGKISFRCQVSGCTRIFKKKERLQDHKLRHSGKKPKYSCDQCEKVLTSAPGLLRHKKAIHEKISKYREYGKRRRQQLQTKCPHCDISTDKYHLASHIKRVHEKAFAINCDICGNRYNCPETMFRHKSDSHGICSVEGCQQEFPGDRQGLRNHQLEAHGREINVFGCEHCGKFFVRVEHLRKHQRNVHQS